MWRNPTALQFASYWYQTVRDEDFDRLGEMLGTRWTRSMVDQLFVENRQEEKRRLDELHIPLALLLEPEFQGQLKKIFGRTYGVGAPKWAKDPDQFEDMFSADREAFKEMFSHLRPMAPTDPWSTIERWKSGSAQPRRKVRRSRSHAANVPEWARKREVKS